MHSTLSPSRLAPRRPLVAVAAVVAACLVAGVAHAQIVPRATHVLRSVGGSEYSFTRLSLRASGLGLNLAGQTFWPSWEGRVGVMMDRPTNPLKDTYVLFQPVPNGLNIRSLHLLTDYYIEGGFRATAGMIRGDAVRSWWDGGGEGLNVSLQRVDSMSMLGSGQGIGLSTLGSQSAPYIGAGYSTRINTSTISSPWRFNADLGLISVNQNNVNRISRTLMGEQGFDELIRDLRLRPLLKVSVGYSF